mmetsp:Transcript_13618/g.21314  ORF Transcript_13618/g.21314 Transcript_13618/m.21314 type:complete len:105 (+) Transcript_13618:371-685(+)
MCASEDLKEFLTADDTTFEATKTRTSERAAFDQELASVLLDGSDKLIETDPSSGYYGETLVNTTVSAYQGIKYLGGKVGGALWSGANYFMGASEDPKEEEIPDR